MKNILLLFTAFVFATAIGFAQTIRGTLQNENKEPVPFANIILVSLPDSTLVKGAISNEKGDFELPSPSVKKIALKVIHLEYKEKTIPIDNPNVGVITLERSINELGEVIVSASRPIMKQQGTVISTNIAQSTLKDLPQVAMVIDFLPGVSKSIVGETEVFGKKNIVYYINNRKIQYEVDLLKISPQEIESIEIETQPGAEFDNSVGAVIRIKLKKKQGDGLGGFMAIQPNFKKGYQDYPIVSLNYRTGRTDFFLLTQLDYRNALLYENNQELSVKTPAHNWNVNTKNIQKDYGKHLIAKTGFAHDINEKHSVGASFMTQINPISGHTFTDQEVQTFQNGSLVGNALNIYDRFNQNKSFAVNAYYEGKLSEKLKFQTDIDYSGMRSDNNSDILEKSLITSTQKNINTHSDAKSDWWGIKTTLSQKIGKGGLSYGFDGSRLSRSEDYRDNVLSSVSDIDNKEIKSAVFASYSFPWGKTNFKTGLRYEYTDFEYFENNQKSNVKSRTYRNLLPNVSVSFPWDNTKWSLSYIKKIRRPAFYELSDYSSYTSSFMYNRGNPNLVPTLTDEFSLLSSYKNYSLSVEYSLVKNSIYEDYRLSTSNPNVIEKTIRNYDDFQTLKFTFSSHHKIGIWHPKLSFTFAKQFGEGVFERNASIFKAGLDSQLLFSEKWMGLLKMNYYTRGSIANTYYYKDRGNVDFLIVRTFPKYSLQVYAGVSDIFNSDKASTEIQNPFISNKSFITNNNSRTFAVVLMYNFNQTNSKYKGHNNEEDKNRL